MKRPFLSEHRLSELGEQFPEGPTSGLKNPEGVEPALRRVVAGFGSLIALGLLTPGEADALLADLTAAARRHAIEGKEPPNG